MTGAIYITKCIRTCVNGSIHMKFLAIGTPLSTGAADLHSFVKKCFDDLSIGAEMNHKMVGIGM